jgi:hypothetical protein
MMIAAGNQSSSVARHVYWLNLDRCFRFIFHRAEHGIARPIHNGVDNDNATRQLWVCECEDEPSDTRHILLPTLLTVQLSKEHKAAVPDRQRTEMTTVLEQYTDIGSLLIAADVCICDTFCCRLYRLPASRRASRRFLHMCRTLVAWRRVLLQRLSMRDRGELSVPQWHERFHAGVYPGLSQADYDGRRIQRSQFVDHETCTHLVGVLSLPAQTTNPEVRVSGVLARQSLSVPASPYMHSGQVFTR